MKAESVTHLTPKGAIGDQTQVSAMPEAHPARRSSSEGRTGSRVWSDWSRLVSSGLVFALALIGGLAAAPGSRAAPPVPQFTLQDLGSLDGSSESGVWGLDGSGRAVGFGGFASASAVQDHAEMWSAGSATQLPGPAGVLGVRALSTTSDGDVVGYAAGVGNTVPLWWHAGTLTALPLDASEGMAFSVNDAGQVVGYTQNFLTRLPRPDGAHAVMWTQGGTPTTLGMLPGDTQSVAYGINQAGVAVGYSQSETGPATAVSFSGGQVTSLGKLSGDTDSEAFAVNAAGDAVGYSAGPDQFHAAAFCPGGSVLDLGVGAGDTHSEALAINTAGVAVGDSDRNGFNRHALLFGGGRAIVLDKQVTNLPSGWSLARATGINNSGQITADAVDSTGKRHAVELTPTGPVKLGDVCSSGTGPQPDPQSDGAGAPVVDGSTVLVHYDYMVLAGPDGYSDAPNPQALTLVQQAFSRQHLTLWIDPSHHAIPERAVVDSLFAFEGGITSPCDECDLGADHDSFYRLKAAYFHPMQSARWHYALFDSRGCIRSTDPTLQCASESGHATEGGKDFVVNDFATYNESFRPDLNPLEDGAHFMHELGHTFGLLHGGFENFNYKPNYVSVMNYAYELNGIPYAAAPGSNVVAGFRLDYSGQALPTLDESNLNESAGVGGSANDTDIILFGNADIYPHIFNEGPSYGPIDWNGNGSTTDTGVQEDFDYAFLQTGDTCLNNPPPASCLYPLRGFNDWAYIKQSLTQDLFVTSQHTGTFQQTGTGSYQLTVTNDGTQPTTAPDIFVLDNPPPGWTITSMTGDGWTCQIPTCSHSGSLAAGTSWPLIMVTVQGGTFARPGANIAQLQAPSLRLQFGVEDQDGDWTNMTYAPPTITSIPYGYAYVTGSVTINGNFLASATEVDLPGGLQITGDQIHVNQDGSLAITIPADAQPGNGPITVHTPGGTATSSQLFNIFLLGGQPPQIYVFNPSSPSSGPPGTSAKIFVSPVTVNSTHVTFTPAAPGDNSTVTPDSFNGDGSITVTVPATAATGPITVTTAYGRTTSSGNFTVTTPPTIIGFTPASGPPGTSVTVTGTNLTIGAGTTVTFTSPSPVCTVLASDNLDGSITAIVPTCAITGTIDAATSQGGAISSQPFTVTAS
jgi:hypothetical protein